MNGPFRNLPSSNAGCGGDPSFAVSRVRGPVLPDTAPLLDREQKPGLIPALARRLLSLLPALRPVGKSEG
jgi:hypothetical protein